MNFSLSSGDYGAQFGPPNVIIPVTSTVAPGGFSGIVESDGYLAFEAENTTSPFIHTDSAKLTTIPGFGYTLSGVTIMPVTAPPQTAPNAPKFSYQFHIFSVLGNDTPGITIMMGDAQNKDTNSPMKYAIGVDDETPQIVQPVPTVMLSVFAPNWSNTVTNALLENMTGHAIAPRTHMLNLWPLNPGLVLEKIVVDLGAVRQSYLGPPESTRL